MKKTLSVLAAFGFFLGMSGMAMAQGSASGEMATSATLQNACTVSTSTMTFPGFAALAGTAAQDADTGTTLKIACTTSSTPTIWSDSTRTLTGNGGEIPFTLSQTLAGLATDDLPKTSVAAQAILAPWVANGSDSTAILHGRILAANFGNKAAGAYTATIDVNVEY